MTINITAKLNDPAIELRRLRCGDGNISPINKNGIEPKPTENPTINTIKLVNGRNLEGKSEKCVLAYLHMCVVAIMPKIVREALFKRKNKFICLILAFSGFPQFGHFPGIFRKL